jgi:predicted dehydrogenase
MRQLFLDKNTIAIKEVAQPLLDEYSVLVSVHYSFISSSTNLEAKEHIKENLFANVPEKVRKIIESVNKNGFEGTAALVKGKFTKQLQPLGYSCAGQVLAVGRSVKRFKTGDWVACAGTGYANHADMTCVPENLVTRIKDKKYVRTASITTIGAIALQGIRQANLELGEIVCVVGLGLIGQLIVQLAKRSGCTVIGIDILPERMALAKQLGADYVYHATEDMIEKELAFLTEHHGVDATIITAASQSSEVMQQAMEVTRKRGRIVIVGDVGLELKRDPFYQKEIDVRVSCSYGPGRYDPVYEQESNDYPYAYVRWTENRNMAAFVQLIEKNEIDIESLISETIDLEHVHAAYERIQTKQVLGVVLSYEQNKPIFKPAERALEQAIQKPLRFVPAVRDTMRVGFIGAGGFAKIKLLPIVSQLKNIHISAVADANVHNSINVSRVYGAAKACTQDDELLEGDCVDAVVIASPHKYHCEQIIKALNAGKAVFVEKPMVTTFEQLELIRATLKDYPNAPLCVDYNRSFSPFINKIKRVVKNRHTPLMISYRMNAGFIPKEHWIQTKVGAGRIIGEACHIFDLFCYLTDAKPVSVSVDAIYASREDIFPTDNFTAHIRFDDGSLCSLMYTALGHVKPGKELMEVFFDSKTIVMDDYLSLDGYGLAPWFQETVSYPEKGHEQLIGRFFEGLRKTEFTPPITHQRLDMVAELTLIIDQLACEGGGSKELAW